MIFARELEPGLCFKFFGRKHVVAKAEKIRQGRVIKIWRMRVTTEKGRTIMLDPDASLSLAAPDTDSGEPAAVAPEFTADQAALIKAAPLFGSKLLERLKVIEGGPVTLLDGDAVLVELGIVDAMKRTAEDSLGRKRKRDMAELTRFGERFLRALEGHA